MGGCLHEEQEGNLYTVLYGQCSSHLLSGSNQRSILTKKGTEKDPIWIMSLIQKPSVGIDEIENKLSTVLQIMKKFYSGYQMFFKWHPRK